MALLAGLAGWLLELPWWAVLLLALAAVLVVAAVRALWGDEEL